MDCFVTLNTLAIYL